MFACKQLLETGCCINMRHTCYGSLFQGQFLNNKQPSVAIDRDFVVKVDLNQALATVVAILKKFPAGATRADDLARMDSLLHDREAQKTEFYVGLSRAIDMTKSLWHLLNDDDQRAVRHAQSDLYAGIEDQGVDVDVDVDRELLRRLEAHALRHNKSLNQVVQDALSGCVSGLTFAMRA